MTTADAVPGGVLRVDSDTVDERVRRCTEHDVSPVEATLVVAAMRAATPDNDDLRLDGPKFCRYLPGGFFRAHRDRSDEPSHPAAVRQRQLSLICLLNDAEPADGLPVFDGGSLVFHVQRPDGRVEPVNLNPPAGSVIVFDSDLMHEVRPVRAGVRHTAVAWLHPGRPEGTR
jgi:predicted 2-oxoglutarate/Fe(II)-dependent dioxygenase YbiX